MLCIPLLPTLAEISQLRRANRDCNMNDNQLGSQQFHRSNFHMEVLSVLYYILKATAFRILKPYALRFFQTSENSSLLVL